MNAQWYGYSTPQASAKVVGGKVAPQVEAAELQAAAEAEVAARTEPPAAVPEEILPAENLKDDLEADESSSGSGLLAKLGIPIAAAVAVWAVIAKVAA